MPALSRAEGPEPRPLRGVALMLAALVLFAVLDATAKHLSQTYAVPLLVWARYTLHCLLMVVFLAPAMRWKLIATRRPGLQIVRATMLVAVTGLVMVAFRAMPLAETTAIVFVTPLLVAVLAGPLLGEKVGAVGWLAMLAGFAGMLLIARPDGQLSATGIAYALAAAVCYALYQIQTRQLAATEDTTAMLFYTALVGTIAMTLALPWYWGGPLPGWMDALLIASLGVWGGTGHWLLTRAFRHAPASTLSPFIYTQLIWATLLGWSVFDDLPDGPAVAGMAIIAAGGMMLAWSNRSQAR